MRNIKHLLGYGGTAVVAIGIGAAIGASSGATGDGTAVAAAVGARSGESAAAPAPTVTVTGTPAPAKTVTKTVKAPPKTKKVTKTVTVKAKPKGPSATIPGDGTFAVGTDIKAGTYVSSTPDSGNCYWARLSGSDGFDSIIDNNNSAGQSIVTIQPGDKYFKTDGCNTWKQR